jgi:hypothetical protein
MQSRGPTNPKLVAKCLGCAANTVDSVMGELRNSPDTNFEVGSLIMTITATYQLTLTINIFA